MIQHGTLTIPGSHNTPQVGRWQGATLRRHVPGAKNAQEIRMGHGYREISIKFLVHNSLTSEAAAWALFESFQDQFEEHEDLKYKQPNGTVIAKWEHCTFDGFELTRPPTPPSNSIGWWFEGVFHFTQLGREP